MNLIFIDTETTGLSEDPYARLLQIAYKTKDTEFNKMYNPRVPISVGAMSTHHITESMVKNLPVFKDTQDWHMFKEMFSKKANIFVAHNAPFDMEMFKREDIKVRSFICTLKVAKRLLSDDKDIKNMKLQNLRYHFGLDMPDAKAHDAAGDVAVLEAVFYKLYDVAVEKCKEYALKKGTPPYTHKQVVERMMDLSQATIEVKQRITFGKHNGKTLEELIRDERGYCEWLVREKTDSNDSLTTTLRYMLNKK